MKKEELMKQYEELKGKGKEPEMIFLYIHMPTGETETIVNPNVEEKMKYIDRTYNEDLVHANCKDIYIEQACICADFGPIMMFSDVVAGQWLFDTFSFRQGIILKETIEELAKLRQHDEDFVTVTEYADNTIRGTDRTKHWRIGGA